MIKFFTFCAVPLAAIAYIYEGRASEDVYVKIFKDESLKCEMTVVASE